METAEKQVTDVVRVDVHLETTADGRRYIQRVSEIVQLDTAIPYPDIDKNDIEYSKAMVDREYYYRTTDRISFTTREILSYDLETDTFVPKQRFTPKTEERIKNNLDPELRMEFECFMLENWGLPEEIKENLANNEEDILGGNTFSRDLENLFGDTLNANLETTTDKAEAVKATTDSVIATMKEKIEEGNKQLVERTKEKKFVNEKGVEIDLSDEFSIGDMGDLFGDDF